MFTSAIRVVPGNGVPMRTPIDCYDSIFRKVLIYRYTLRPDSTPLLVNSMNVPAKHQGTRYQQSDLTCLLHRPVEFTTQLERPASCKYPHTLVPKAWETSTF